MRSANDNFTKLMPFECKAELLNRFTSVPINSAIPNGNSPPQYEIKS